MNRGAGFGLPGGRITPARPDTAGRSQVGFDFVGAEADRRIAELGGVHPDVVVPAATASWMWPAPHRALSAGLTAPVGTIDANTHTIPGLQLVRVHGGTS